jgi:hypothetical protein
VVRRFVNELKLGMPVALDENGDVTRLYDVNAYPTTVVIGADGRVQLYQTGAIANAEVAFDNIVPAQMKAIRAGHGITREAYVAALAKEPARMKPVDRRTEGPVLEGRGKAIAARMPCPCGCSDLVAECGCRTAKAIKTRLAANAFGNQTDAEVMEALNKEFCMKGM